LSSSWFTTGQSLARYVNTTDFGENEHRARRVKSSFHRRRHTFKAAVTLPARRSNAT